MRLALVLATLLSCQVARADSATDAFQKEARALAKRTKRTIYAWGTARIGGTGPALRFATLQAIPDPPKADDTKGWNSYCDAGLCRGAYLVEEAPGRLWLVSYNMNRYGWTVAWPQPPEDEDAEPAPKPDVEPPFVERTETGIAHVQMHNHGNEHMTFALRRGRWVMLAFADENRSGDEDRTFEKNGVCGRRCPALAGFEPKRTLDYVHIRVAGPAATVADLHEVTVPDDE